MLKQVIAVLLICSVASIQSGPTDGNRTAPVFGQRKSSLIASVKNKDADWKIVEVDLPRLKTLCSPCTSDSCAVDPELLSTTKNILRRHVYDKCQPYFQGLHQIVGTLLEMVRYNNMMGPGKDSGSNWQDIADNLFQKVLTQMTRDWDYTYGLGQGSTKTAPGISQFLFSQHIKSLYEDTLEHLKTLFGLDLDAQTPFGSEAFSESLDHALKNYAIILSSKAALLYQDIFQGSFQSSVIAYYLSLSEGQDSNSPPPLVFVNIAILSRFIHDFRGFQESMIQQGITADSDDFEMPSWSVKEIVERGFACGNELIAHAEFFRLLLTSTDWSWKVIRLKHWTSLQLTMGLGKESSTTSSFFGFGASKEPEKSSIQALPFPINTLYAKGASSVACDSFDSFSNEVWSKISLDDASSSSSGSENQWENLYCRWTLKLKEIMNKVNMY